MSDAPSPLFGKLRSFFWPVHRDELKVFTLMLVIFFLICLNYTLLRTVKDALVITAKSSGADALPFIKTYAILPMSLLMMLLFTRLSNRFNTEKVFYVMISIFISFFFLFSFVIYPFHESLHPHLFADQCEKLLPAGFHGLISIFRNWTFTAYYVMSELWSPAIVTVLFWGFVNEITSVEAAKRFYPILAVVANVSSIFSGNLATFIANLGISLNAAQGADAWAHSLKMMSLVIFIAGLATMAIFRWLNKSIHNNPLAKSGSFKLNEKDSSIKMGLRKNFSFLVKSPYLLYIAVIVLGFNIAMNLTEVIWKDRLHQLCHTPNEYLAYMGKVSIAIGVVATIAAILCGKVIDRFSWTTGALVTPVILLVTGIGFFSFLFFDNIGMESLSMFFGASPLAIAVFFGAMQHSLSRASKYTFFDATKEMAFIPLDRESKLKGKAAIDGVGSRLGKSGSALFFQGLLMTLGSLSQTLPYVAFFLLLVIIGWIIAVRRLGREFQKTQAPGFQADTANAQQIL